jgi:hypothetical protein
VARLFKPTYREWAAGHIDSSADSTQRFVHNPSPIRAARHPGIPLCTARKSVPHVL